MKAFLTRLIKGECDVTVVECGMIAALISVAIIIGVKAYQHV